MCALEIYPSAHLSGQLAHLPLEGAVRHVPQGRPMGRVGELSAGQPQGRIFPLHRRSLLAQPVGACAVLEVVVPQDRMKLRPFYISVQGFRQIFSDSLSIGLTVN